MAVDHCLLLQHLTPLCLSCLPQLNRTFQTYCINMNRIPLFYAVASLFILLLVGDGEGEEKWVEGGLAEIKDKISLIDFSKLNQSRVKIQCSFCWWKNISKSKWNNQLESETDLSVSKTVLQETGFMSFNGKAYFHTL